ncbi:MAG: DUF695 domain-containing protein [Actinoplanes sp.]
MIFKRRARADPTEAFWTWWATARAQVEKAIDDGSWPDDLVAAISRRVEAIDPGLGWEFSAGTTSKHLLIVTANGDRKLRSVAERWRRAGPAPDETFGYAAARQASPSALGAKLQLAGTELDLEELRFGAETDDDAAQVDVRVWHPAFAGLDHRSRTQVAFLALDWLLGEDGVEIWVRVIDATPTPGPALTAAQLALVVAGLSPDGRPQWTILSGTRAGRPILVTVQVPLKSALWPAADTHIRLEVPYRMANEGGLPIEESLAALHAFEDRIFAYADGPILVAHETANGTRIYHLYADRRPAVDALEPIVASWPEGRVRTKVTPDPGWECVAHLRP